MLKKLSRQKILPALSTLLWDHCDSNFIEHSTCNMMNAGQSSQRY